MKAKPKKSGRFIWQSLLLLVTAGFLFNREEVEVFQTVDVTRGDLDKQVLATGNLTLYVKSMGAQVVGNYKPCMSKRVIMLKR
ncbi:hypothetical protein J4727_07925 [Providencia rettgeri]|uniref:Uncharacterized protein n=1 Tax=Providencia rettgeri TaxID=587 RepID=A0A939NFB4_PRORE|nr:hypothetical protein [Providencia rettgeri]